MSLKLKNPLSFFDLETTGINVVKDRIVEISIVKLMVNGEIIKKTLRVNPTIPIPLESSLIHGIYDEDIKDAPTFKSIAKEVAKFMEGSDLSGYNVLKFDIPVLVEEFLRAEIDFDLSHRKVVDVQRIFHMMEKRNLTAAYKFYCHKELMNAHSAEADTIATMEVLESQVSMYDGMDVTDMKGNKIGVIENDIDTLHQLTNNNLVDLAGRMVFNNQGKEVFNFGKHKNKEVSKIFDVEPSYYDWMMKGDFALDTKRKLTVIKLRNFNQK